MDTQQYTPALIAAGLIVRSYAEYLHSRCGLEFDVDRVVIDAMTDMHFGRIDTDTDLYKMTCGVINDQQSRLPVELAAVVADSGNITGKINAIRLRISEALADPDVTQRLIDALNKHTVVVHED